MGYIVTGGGGSTDTGDTYSSDFHDNHYNVSIWIVVFPRIIGSYINAWNMIDSHNKMHPYYLGL